MPTDDPITTFQTVARRYCPYDLPAYELADFLQDMEIEHLTAGTLDGDANAQAHFIASRALKHPRRMRRQHARRVDLTEAMHIPAPRIYTDAMDFAIAQLAQRLGREPVDLKMTLAKLTDKQRLIVSLLLMGYTQQEIMRLA